MAEKIKVALLGAGNVGSQAARILVEDNAVLEKRIGAPRGVDRYCCARY